MPFWQATCVLNFRTFTVLLCNKKWNFFLSYRFYRHLRSIGGTIFQVFLPVVLVIVGLVLSKTLGQATEDNSVPSPILITPAYYTNITNSSSQSGRFGSIPNLLVRDTASKYR